MTAYPADRCSSRLSLAAAVALLALPAAFAQTTRYVSPDGNGTTGADWANAHQTVAAALAAAGDGDTIRVAGRTFTLTAALDWTLDNLTLQGGYEADPGETPGPSDPLRWPTILARDTAATIRLLSLTGNNAVIARVTFSNGLANVVGSTWDAQGGALRAVNAANLLVSECRFVRNRALGTAAKKEADGGAIYLSGGSATLTNTVLEFNTAEIAAGSVRGGALYAVDLSALVLSDCRLAFNRIIAGGTGGKGYGGGAALASIADARLTDCRLLQNHIGLPTDQDGWGGGLHALNVTGVISNTVIAGNRNLGSISANRDSFGAGMHVEGGAWTVAHSAIVGNALRGAAGRSRGDGVFIDQGNHVFRNVLVANNHNYREKSRGAFWGEAGTVVAENLTLAGHVGLGLYVKSGAAMTLRNSILYDNTTDVGGTGTPVLHNNLIGDGTADGIGNNFQDDPLFEFPLYYVAANSPALGAGDRSADAAGLAGLTVRTNGATYGDPAADAVHLGYHFSAGLGVDLELWVDPVAGDDGDSGTESEPVKSITRALELAASRTRIHLAAGIYTSGTETFPLKVDGSTIQLIGTNAATTIITAQGANRRVIEWANSPLADNRIEGVTIRGGNPPAVVDPFLNVYLAGGVFLSATALTLNNVAVFDNGVEPGVGNVHGGGLYAWQATVAAEECVFSANRATTGTASGQQAYGGGLHLSGGLARLHHLIVVGNNTHGRDPTSGGGMYMIHGRYSLRNVLVAHNRARADPSRGGGIYVGGHAEAAIENATLHGHSEEGLYSGDNAETVVRNSIVMHNFPDVGGSTVTLANNLIGDGRSDGVDGNFQADPRLELPLLYLASGSPATNRGDCTAASAGVAGRTSFRNGATYADPTTEAVNLGYHFAAGVPAIDVELWIDPASGLDGNAGSAGQPLKTITEALNRAGAATRIHLAAGDYTHPAETFPLRIEGRAIQLIGTNRASTVINAAGANQRVIEWMHSPLGDNRIEGLTIRGGKPLSATASRDGAGIHAVNVALVITNALITDNNAGSASGSLRQGGGLFAERCAGVVWASTFSDNSAQAGTAASNRGRGGAANIMGGFWLMDRVEMIANEAYGRGGLGGGIFLDYGYLLLRNALIARNRARDTNQGELGGGFYTERGGVLRLENTTVVRNAPDGLYRTINQTAIPIYNTIVWGNTNRVSLFYLAAGTNDLSSLGAGIDHTTVYHSLASELTAGVRGNLKTNPLFIDPDGGDFRLQSLLAHYDKDGKTPIAQANTSPAIDAGTNRTWMAGVTDLQRFPRSLLGLAHKGAAVPDMGAYEVYLRPPAPQGTLFSIR